MGKKATQHDIEEFHYARFKQALREFNVVPDSAGEARVVCAKLRKAARAKFYGMGVAAILAGILTLVMIVGFMILPLGIICVVQGMREVRRIRRYEERYIRERFTAIG
ncbi:hypothetical protein TW86_22920 [Halomonas sp. S2151]|uniref:hypothetical protein n=1 Tax=Halomonas sp. S2151 TaxID=579478 RepID=UPI0005F9B435|nr:hypothetical protein [Halomonas sp. S2151]KJZ03079.1 hypothetical protein TW86_22920 [Halomonas sp. S2151]